MQFFRVDYDFYFIDPNRILKYFKKTCEDIAKHAGWQLFFTHTNEVSSVAKCTLSVREVWGSIPGPVKSTQCRQRLATVAMFLRSSVAQALSRRDGPHHSFHVSA